MQTSHSDEESAFEGGSPKVPPGMQVLALCQVIHEVRINAFDTLAVPILVQMSI
jgi:hypothetical protein